MTFMERMKTTVIHGSVLASRTKVDMWDDEGLTEIFGMDRNERRADMADATQGRGYTTINDLD
jgi:hypothetical protein